MAKSKYDTYTHSQLVEELKKLSKRKKYGLVWEEEKTSEKFESEAEGKLPILTEDKKREIKTDIKKPVNILIEGDNYHALSVLNYTHAKSIDVIYIDPPYNTGAKDWKYNNDYVDKEDDYKHSKWLSFMHNRLVLAKKLLKPNGVLIVTIDDYELLSVLGLLENLRAKTLGRVSICIKPEGRRQSKYFMEAHEYAIFVSWGSPSTRNLNSDFGLDFPDEDTTSKFRWEGLMRRDASREDRGSDYWFPFYVGPNGELSTEFFKGSKELFPINTKGIERVWLWDKQRAQDNISELQAVIRKERTTIYYKRREQGRVKPTSFWYGSKYNANAYGTRLLTSILPDNDFNFPKSLYSVLDCIDLFLPKENGIVLDFFAGSGTTGHATLELNKDNGNRKFILCTNNENNICHHVTYPRIKKVIEGFKIGSKKEKIEGLGGNLKYYKTNFVGSEPTHRNKKLLTEKSIEMLCIRENTFEEVLINTDIAIFKGEKKYTAILFNEMKMEEFKRELNKFKLNISVYVFSLEGDDFSEDFEDLKSNITICSIPEVILKVYRRIYETTKSKK
jgi:adenine-specific DNA-methyltransferase